MNSTVYSMKVYESGGFFYYIYCEKKRGKTPLPVSNRYFLNSFSTFAK